MDYSELSGATISERDKAFAKTFADFVNGSMFSPDQTGRELPRAHRYLQQQMFKVFLGFMKQLAYNYQQGRYDDRNEWASRLSAEAYQRLIECDLIFDPEFPTSK
ncbi:MAG: sulfide:quinone reductase [Bacteroides sp.]|nr:sulfide:quinone reductase [Bacteroides sp.]